MFGIVGSIKMMFVTRKAILDEHDRHLYDLACMVDQNLSNEIVRCNVEIDALINSGFMEYSETLFEQNGDKTAIREVLNASSLMTQEYVTRFLVWNEDRELFSNDFADNHQYHVVKGNAEGGYQIYHDDTADCDYIAVVRRSIHSDLTYVLLIDIEAFYGKLVSNTIYDHYWTVLYDVHSGLAIHNDPDEPVHNYFTEEEVLARDDGFTLMYYAEESGESVTQSYSYDIGEGLVGHNRFTIIPSNLTKNGEFGVGVSVYENEIIKPAERRFLCTLGASLTMAFGIALAVFYLIHSNRRAKELAAEIAALERQNELSSDLLRRQEELSHHQKLETIGILTAGIAHEFNNLLSPIMSGSMLILENTASEEGELYDNALEIYNASYKAKQLVANISKLSRKNNGTHMKAVSPEKLIDGVIGVMGGTIPKNIRIQINIRTTKNILGLENELGHLLLNLALNAIQVMEPNDGTLTFEAWDDGDHIFLSVSDTGKGIPPENLDTIFEPFFTTKESGKGTGLGLAIAQQTAITHDGSIAAENNPDGGAKFTVKLRIFVENETKNNSDDENKNESDTRS